jgi:hypothetical protein
MIYGASNMVREHLDSLELSSVGELPPIWRLATNIEREATDAVVRKGVCQNDGSVHGRVKLAYSEGGADPGVASTNNEKSHSIPFGKRPGKTIAKLPPP